MARVPYLGLEDLAPEHQSLLARRANIYRALANSPNGLAAFSGLAGYIRFKSPLDARLRELAILMVGYLTREPYEWSHHIEIGRKFGVTDADIRALMEEAEGRPSALEPLAKAVLTAAREMTRTSPSRMRPSPPCASTSTTSESSIWCYHRLLLRGRARAGEPADRRRDDYQRLLDEFPLPAAAKARSDP